MPTTNPAHDHLALAATSTSESGWDNPEMILIPLTPSTLATIQNNVHDYQELQPANPTLRRHEYDDYKNIIPIHENPNTTTAHGNPINTDTLEVAIEKLEKLSATSSGANSLTLLESKHFSAEEIECLTMGVNSVRRVITKDGVHWEGTTGDSPTPPWETDVVSLEQINTLIRHVAKTYND